MPKLIVLFVVAFVDMVGIAMVIPLLPFYATDLGVGAAAVGVLISAFSLAQLACAPAWGRFSDKFGRRPAILAGLGITALAYGMFAMADSIWLLLAARIVQGMGGGTIGVVQAYVADVSSDHDRTKSLGWLSAVSSMGAVVGPALGSVAISMGGRHAPGIAVAGIAVMVALFAWFQLRETDVAQPTGEHRVRTPRSGLSAIRQVATNLGDPAARLIWIYAIAIGAFYGTVPVMPLLLGDRLGVTEHTIGYAIMYLGAMGVVIRSLILGRMVDWLGEERLSRLGIIILAVGLALMGVTSGYPTLVASLTLMPLGTAFLFPAVTGQLSKVVSKSERGLYMGVQHTFGGVSRVAFPIAAGVMMDHVGLGVPFLVAGALVLLSLPLASRPPAPSPSTSTGTGEVAVAGS